MARTPVNGGRRVATKATPIRVDESVTPHVAAPSELMALHARSDAPAFSAEYAIAVVMAYGNASEQGTCRLEIMAMLRHQEIDPDRIAVMNQRGVDIARNRAVEQFLSRRECDWLVMVDRDMIPTADTAPFFTAQGHVVGAMYPLGDEKVWAEPDRLHCGLMRIHRSVVEKVSPPWFKFVTNERGTMLTECECHYFTRRAKAAGFDVIRAGYCGHAPFGKHRG